MVALQALAPAREVHRSSERTTTLGVCQHRASGALPQRNAPRERAKMQPEKGACPAFVLVILEDPDARVPMELDGGLGQNEQEGRQEYLFRIRMRVA